MTLARLFTVALLLVYSLSPVNSFALDFIPIPHGVNAQKTWIVDTTIYDCIRGKPTPALDSTKFVFHVFKPINAIAATETVILANGNRLIVSHGGCEYFVQTYRFEVTAAAMDTIDLGFWYNQAVALMREIEAANVSPMAISAAISALQTFADSDAEKRLEIPFDLVDSEIRHFVSLEKVELLGENKYGVEIMLAIGPL